MLRLPGECPRDGIFFLEESKPFHWSMETIYKYDLIVVSVSFITVRIEIMDIFHDDVNAVADRGSVQPHTRVMRTGFFPGFLPLASWAINFNWDGDWLSCISERKKHGDKRKYEIDGRENPSFRFSIDKKTGLATLDCSYGNPNPSRTGQIHHDKRRNRQSTLHSSYEDQNSSRIRHRDMGKNNSVVRHLYRQHPRHRETPPHNRHPITSTHNYSLK